MANNLGYTPGSGAAISTVQFGDSSHGQVVVLSIGSERTPVPADADHGLLVNVSQIQGNVTIGGTVAATQSGTWNIATLATITNPVTVEGSVSIDGTATVGGTVTANQGTAAAAASAWPTKISDGTNIVGLTNTSGSIYALKVDVIKQVGGGYSQQDKTAFTEGTTFTEVVGGVFNDSFVGSPSSGQASVVRITAKRAFHVNLRDSSGAELAVTANPLIVAPIATNFPINLVQVAGNAVVAAANGIQKVGISDAAGAAFSAANPLPTTPVPNAGTFWSNTVTYTASQTDQAIRTPTGGKTSYVQGLIIIPTGAGTLEISDGNHGTATTDLLNGAMPSSGFLHIAFNPPRPLAAVNDVLRYTSGSGSAGNITAWGHEA